MINMDTERIFTPSAEGVQDDTSHIEAPSSKKNETLPTTEKEISILLGECKEALNHARDVLKRGEKIKKEPGLRDEVKGRAARLNAKVLTFVGLGLASWAQFKVTNAGWEQVSAALTTTDAPQASPEQSPRGQQKNAARQEMVRDLQLSYNEATQIQNWVDARLLEKRQQVIIDMMVSGTHLDRTTVADPTIRAEFERRLSQKIFENSSEASGHITGPVGESEAEKTVRVTRAIQLYLHRISGLLLQDYTTGGQSDFDRGPERLMGYWGDS